MDYLSPNISDLDISFEIKDENNHEINGFSHPYLFFYKDDEENEKSCTCRRTYKKFYHLRCIDRTWKGTAKYNITNGKISINNNCTKDYKDHSYIKEKIIKKKYN